VALDEVEPMTVQLSLPGQAHVAEGPIDHNGMYVMHFAFRRDLADLVGAVARTPVEGNATWTRLRDYWDLFAELLHHHHTAEDDHYWPALADAVRAHGTPADWASIAAMEDEHAAIGPALDRCRQAFHAMLTDPSLSHRDDLHDHLVDARCVIEDHMSHEESETLPLVSRVMASATYAEVEKRIGRSYPLRILATLVPWAFHGLPTNDAQQLLALAPPPQRLLLRLTQRRFARRHRATFAHPGSR
jgi:hemerythrin-like domain-containing protein